MSSALELGDKDPVVLTAGRLWDESKNVASLGPAAAALPWPVLVAGPSAAQGGGAVADVPGLQFLGELPRDDLHALMRRAAVFTAPALYEPFGLTVLEAARAGCALVLSDRPGFRELWNDAAVFVDPHDPSALSRALCGLVADRGRRRRLQQQALRQAARYTSAPMVRAYAALYRDLLRTAACAPAPHDLAEAAS
jgi:glycosyltransferase involved in cell wall biosynthesis